MSTSRADADRRIAGLCAALGEASGGAAVVLSEQLFEELIRYRPGVARVAASLLRSLCEAEPQHMAGAVIARLADRPSEDLAAGDALVVASAGDDDRPRVDVLVVSVKEVELLACLRAFGVGPRIRPTVLRGGLEAWFVENSGRRFAIANIGRDGNVESALKLAGLFGALRFGLTVLVGMAAGVKGAVSPGDVVVAESVWATDFRIIRPGGAESPRPRTYDPPSSAFERLASMSQVDPEWSGRVRQEALSWIETDASCGPPPAGTEDWHPQYRQGVVFAGSVIVEDGSLPGLRQERHGRLLAAEMEGAGFAAAASEHRSLADWLVVRGIADFGEEDRVQDWQFAATFAAAALLRDGVAHGRLGSL